jgi:polar amino acid transport system substrate-binding protein
MKPSVLGVLILVSLLQATGSVGAVRIAVSSGMEAVIDYEDGSLLGALAPLYECVFDKAFFQFDYVEMPLKRGVRSLQEGSVSVVLPMSKTAKRDATGEFGGELFQVDYVLVSNAPLGSIEKEKQAPVYGVPRGFVGADLLKGEVAKIEEVSKYDQLVPMLKYNRIDAALIPGPLLNTLFGDGVVNLHQRHLATLPASFYASRTELTNHQLLALRNSVKNCRLSDGTYEVINGELRQWFSR